MARKTKTYYSMDKKLIIANWKSHKTIDETRSFLESIREKFADINFSNKEVVLSPSFTSLMFCYDFIKNNSLPLKLCAQNVSSYPEGAYTGEINAKQIKEFADFVLIGHSERKRYLNENENDVESKIKEAKDAGLKVVQCIQDENSRLHKDADVIAFEPPNAISTFGVGDPDSPEDVTRVFSSLEGQLSGRRILYGGSVDKANVASYAQIKSCGGFLVGGASLNPDSFFTLLSSC